MVRIILQPMLLYLFVVTHIVAIVVVVASSTVNSSLITCSSSTTNSTSQPEERGMARLLGRQGAESFVQNVRGGDRPYFVPASSSHSTDLLWSKSLSEHYLKNGGKKKPWAFETDIKIVKNGQVYYESNTRAATWNDVQTSLQEGATVVMHDLQQRHDPIHDLCAELEDELEVFLNANSYLTPGGSTGFDPHYDWHDILVLQLEGSKTWTVCEQRDVDIYEYRNGGGRRIFPHGEDFGNCTEYLFRPGDVFYAPFGTIHYARANDGSVAKDENDDDDDYYSMHLTLSLIRQQFTWGQFLQDIVESSSTDRFSGQFSAIVAKSKSLQTQIPKRSLQDIGYSLDNSDLPPGFIEKIRHEVKSIVRKELSSNEPLRTLLLKLLDKTNEAVEDTVDLYRYKMVLGRLREKHNCPLPISDVNTASFRRIPHQRMMIAEVEDYGAIVMTGETEEEQIVFPLRWKNGLRFALGLGGAGMTYFTAEDLITKAKMEREDAITLIRKLVDSCLLEWSLSQSISAPEQESCAA